MWGCDTMKRATRFNIGSYNCLCHNGTMYICMASSVKGDYQHVIHHNLVHDSNFNANLQYDIKFRSHCMVCPFWHGV